ncbi:MAG: glucose-6-phosphate dehydrogenase [Actinomycetota bacterium]|nr:glucose-6-phosphate dehydrogenase [Actinomycetota bacterium]
MLTPPDHVIVIFGANGDLARRKLLPAFYHLEQEGLMPKNYRIIGNSRSEMTDDEFRNFALEGTREFGRTGVQDEVWTRFARRLTYIAHELVPDDTQPVVDAVHEAESQLRGDCRRLYYLSVPPSAFGTITRSVGETGLSSRARLVIEKPFGWDLKSFRELRNTVKGVLKESQVYRIDHFLGKETVQNILALRFANGMFEPVWNRQHIDHVQIDVPETLGIGGRGSFYEATGALRDMIVTHLFQVLAFVAMEPPTSFSPRPLMNESAKVFESMQVLRPEDVVYGQYYGYREEQGVATDSRTETYAAARVCIDNWRWAGVPFFLRTGKRMAESRQAVTLVFKEPPRQMFKEVPNRGMDQDYLSLELGENESISVSFLAKAPGPSIELAPARMNFDYEGSFGSDLIEAYERLLHDALIGDRTLFTRADGIERTWEVVEPVLQNPPDLDFYDQESWGPECGHQLIAPRRWRLPDNSERVE